MIRNQPNHTLLNALRLQIDTLTERLQRDPESRYADAYQDAITDSIEILFYNQSNKAAIQIRIQLNEDVLKMGTRPAPRYEDYIEALTQDCYALMQAIRDIEAVSNSTEAQELTRKLQKARLRTKMLIKSTRSIEALQDRATRNGVLCERINCFLAPMVE